MQPTTALTSVIVAPKRGFATGCSHGMHYVHGEQGHGALLLQTARLGVLNLVLNCCNFARSDALQRQIVALRDDLHTQQQRMALLEQDASHKSERVLQLEQRCAMSER